MLRRQKSQEELKMDSDMNKQMIKSSSSSEVQDLCVNVIQQAKALNLSLSFYSDDFSEEEKQLRDLNEEAKEAPKEELKEEAKE